MTIVKIVQSDEEFGQNYKVFMIVNEPDLCRNPETYFYPTLLQCIAL